MAAEVLDVCQDFLLLCLVISPCMTAFPLPSTCSKSQPSFKMSSNATSSPTLASTPESFRNTSLIAFVRYLPPPTLHNSSLNYPPCWSASSSKPRSGGLYICRLPESLAHSQHSICRLLAIITIAKSLHISPCAKHFPYIVSTTP